MQYASFCLAAYSIGGVNLLGPLFIARDKPSSEDRICQVLMAAVQQTLLKIVENRLLDPILQYAVQCQPIVRVFKTNRFLEQVFASLECQYIYRVQTSRYRGVGF